MGELHYGTNNSVFEFEDRLLHHLKLVISNKLRRGESFVFTWNGPDAETGTTLWLHPSIPLYFTFGALSDSQINRAWAEVLSFHANSPSGLTLVDEPELPE